MQKYMEQLNAPQTEQRLSALRELIRTSPRAVSRDVNSHIHTFYSFSPYSPSLAVYRALQANLATAGIMDHDTVAGAREFLLAGDIASLSVTVGMECRASFAKTPLNNRRINNPDQSSIAYVALHGVPHTQLDALTDYMLPYCAHRMVRSRAMTEKLDALLQEHDLHVDFDADVMPLSMVYVGGTVTERHILFAAAKKIASRFGRGANTVSFIKNELVLPLTAKVEEHLCDGNNPFYDYDLLNVLKSELVKRIYIDAKSECPPIKELSAFARAHGIVLSYAYLGDVGQSVTGDKRAQTFEDAYLDELFDLLHELDFCAVTYMPSRNTSAQLKRLRELCQVHGFFQISGEDINQPRQSFVCEAMRAQEFSNLYDSAWALIGHERAATQDLEKGMFSQTTIANMPDLNERIQFFSRYAKGE